MRDLREEAKQLAPHEASVLILGEPGTGREAFARYIHSLSARAGAPFVVAMAGAMSDTNAESVLYGTETGGTVRKGLLEEAERGMLFINELGDLPAAAQRLLFAALDSGGFVRQGGTTQVACDLRVISSAQSGFESRGAPFRQDLLSLLSVLSLNVPPLREYSEDVPDLLRYYVDRLVDDSRMTFRRFGVAAQNRLRNYPWPGNMRELKNLVQRLLIRGGPEEIPLEEIERELGARATAADEPLVKQDLLALPLREAREHFERAYLTQQLQLCSGKVGQLAKRVGMERTHLYRKLRSLGVDFRQSEE
jgi:DNA-binding NtrC family response regulator